MIKFFLHGILCVFCVKTAAGGEIKVVYPYEGLVIPSVSSTFLFGSIVPSTAPFYINGSSITVHQNGGFIAYLPVSEGNFAFNCELKEDAASVFYIRNISVKPSATRQVSTATIAIEVILPSGDAEFMPGDWINVYAAGTPGKNAVFSIDDAVKNMKMSEIPGGSGRYYGTYQVGPLDLFSGSPVKAKFRTSAFSRTAMGVSKGKVSAMKKWNIVETSTETVILRSGPGMGYTMFLPEGVKLVSDGKAAGMRRIRLNNSESAWVDESKVRTMPSDTFAPVNETGTIRVKNEGKYTSVSISGSEKIPYAIEESGRVLSLFLYYSKLHTNWIVYDSSDVFVDRVSFRQVGSEVSRIDVALRDTEKLWGYDVYYSTKSLVLELKHAPAIAAKWPAPLGGLKVVVDPGHSPKNDPPYDGAVGPLGSFEYEVNLKIAQKLAEKLLEAGATVYMTRYGEENVALVERPKIARAAGGDIFISIHNNAIADGENPFAAGRGFSVYHYHQHSFELAKAVHASYLKNINLADEGLRYGDYLVARMTYMPSILVENAYMILPEQEEMLNNPDFQAKLADTITGGILDFFRIGPKPEPKKKKTGKKGNKVTR
ncbi:MAG: N-acetylmuramoyl-L-alanine amidase [Elusimicrobia bacterium]|nr:N-acetylmuramoyl-L-alanine amidase [Elusimicrobiota bacterium]